MAETTRSRSTETARQTDVGRPGGLRLAGRRVQLPQLVLALLLIAMGALASVVLYTQASSRQPVLAAAHDLERGQVVAAEDLQVVYVGSDDPILSIPPDQIRALVGQVAVTGLEAGTVVTAGLFAERTVVGEGEGVVGVSLPPGAYPTVQLASGDVVDVVDTESAEGVVASGAVVFDVAELGVQGQRLVSLRLPAETASQVASVPEERLRLILVAETSP